MEELNYLNPTELLEKIYETLCSEYEDEPHYSHDQDKQAIEVTKKRLTKKVFNEFVVDDEYFLTMDEKKFNDQYRLYEKDFFKIIESCSQNGVPYATFLQIIDQLLASAHYRINAFEQMNGVIRAIEEENKGAQVEEGEDVESNEESE